MAAVAGSAGRCGVRRRRARDNHRRTTRRVMRPLQRHTPDRTPAACGCVAGVASRRAERAVRADPPVSRRAGRGRRRASVVCRGGAPKLHMLSQTLGEPGIVSAEHRPDLILERKTPDSRQRPPVQRRQRLRRPLLNLRMRSITLSLKLGNHVRVILGSGTFAALCEFATISVVDCFEVGLYCLAFVFGLDAGLEGVSGDVDDLGEAVGVFVHVGGDCSEDAAGGVGRSSFQPQIRGDLPVDVGDLGQLLGDRGKQVEGVLNRAGAPFLDPVKPIRIRRSHNKLLPATDAYVLNVWICG